jgi:hypothetical protein
MSVTGTREGTNLSSSAFGPAAVEVRCCGDGTVNQAVETCDTDPQNSIPNDPQECGNAATSVVCNPASAVNKCRAPTDANAPCTICGDGIVQLTATDPVEQCDDGARRNANLPFLKAAEACRNDCTYCGDGIFQAGAEDCDPSAPNPPIGCTNDCVTTTTSTPPDCSAAIASPDRLWPPNRRFNDIAIDGVTDPEGDPITITITGITQDEPLTGRRGAGRKCPDATGVGSPTAIVRAERIGRRDGRVYHVSFTADDGRGGQCTGLVTVCVPHDRRPGQVCIDEGPLQDSTGPCP